MRRSFGRLFLVMASLAIPLVPMSASADTVSLSQTITITATVAPARSIVINNSGQMVKIYSNTPLNVTPTVYQGEAPGPVRPLTPALLRQYQQVISQQKFLNGVAITVPLPVAKANGAGDILMKTISSLTRPLYL